MTPHLVSPSWSTCSQIEFGWLRRARGLFDEHIGLAQRLTDATARAVEPSRVAFNSNELRDTFERGLVADIRSNSGVGYLNTIADAIRKVSEASAAAA